MRPATDEFWEEYCKAIINAQSDEEIEMIKQEMIIKLKEYGYTDESIQAFFARETEMETFAELGTQNNNENMSQGPLIVGLGIGASAFVAALALKKSILKKSKQRGR